MAIIAPSILSADFAELGRDIKLTEEAGADWIHIDVMDGNFVPNITIGIPVVSAIRKYTKLPFDVHLMIENPQNYIANFAKAGADLITFHYEAERHADRCISLIKEHGCKAGITLNPSTPVSAIKDLVKVLDFVLIMSVNPGFGGQKFIEYTYDKVRELKKLKDEKNPNLIIEVDGGVDVNNIKKLHDCGVDAFVAGSSVYKNRAMKENIEALRNALK